MKVTFDDGITGSIREVRPGVWRGERKVGDIVDGKIPNGTRKYAQGPSKEAVRATLVQAQADHVAKVERDTSLTVGAFLNDWSENVAPKRPGRTSETQESGLSANAIENIRWACGHLVKGLGKIKLDQLEADDVEAFLRKKAADGFARASLVRLLGVLRRALKHAQRQKLIPATYKTAADLVEVADIPTKARKAVKGLTRKQADDLLEAAKGHRLEALIVLALKVGLRPGELTGLQWSDVDLDGDPPTVKVRGSLKKETINGVEKLRLGGVKVDSDRTLSIPPSVVEVLRAHGGRQLEERLHSRTAWKGDFVFTTSNGTPIAPSNLRKIVKKLGTDAGLDEVTPYQLRHSANSLLAAKGVGPEERSRILGNSERVNVETYTHGTTEVEAVPELLG